MVLPHSGKRNYGISGQAAVSESLFSVKIHQWNFSIISPYFIEYLHLGLCLRMPSNTRMNFKAIIVSELLKLIIYFTHRVFCLCFIHNRFHVICNYFIRTPPNVSNASSRNEKSISCVLEREILYTLNLEFL